MIKMTMDHHRRLQLIIIAVVFTLHAKPIMSEINTNFVTNNSTPKEECSDGEHFTKDGKNDGNMTMAPETNTHALWRFQATKFPSQHESFGSNPTVKDEYYRNASDVHTTRNNIPVVNSDAMFNSSIKMPNTTERITFSQRYLDTDTFTFKSVTKDLNNKINNTTESALRFAQRLTTQDVITISTSKSDTSSQLFTKGRLISNTTYQEIKTHKAVNTKAGDMITIPVTGTSGTNYETSESGRDYIPTENSAQSLSKHIEHNIGHTTSYNDNVSSDPKHDHCDRYGGCDLVPGPLWYCQCDDLCEEYNDCCRDYAFNNKDPKLKYTCVGIRDDNSIQLGIKAISVCPDVFTNSTIMSLCTDGLLGSVGPPVLDINDKSRVYRNKYCAMCHRVDALSFDIAFMVDPFWFRDIDDVLHLTDMEFRQYLLSVTRSRLIIPEDANVRYCITNIYRNDNYLCNLYSNPILLPNINQLFRNTYCVETSHEKLPTECLTMYDFSEMFKLDIDGLSGLTSKLTIIFSFNRKDVSPTQDKCQTWSEENDKDCAHLPKYMNALISLNYDIRLPTNVTNLEMMQSVLLTLIAKQIDNFTTVSLPYKLFVDEDLTLVNVQAHCKISKTVFGHELSAIKRKITNQRVVITEKSNNDRQFMVTNERRINLNRTMRFLGLLSRDLSKRSKLYSHFGVPDLASTKFCDEVKIEVERLPTNSLSVITMDCTCTSDISLQRQTSYLPILTYVFSGVSCASLIVMIVYNRLHHLHYGIPFANLENIGLSSIFSTILLPIGQIAPYVNKRVCYSISVISHYSWLLVFSFKSLAVIYIVQTLMQIKGRRLKTKENKINKRRKITGFGLTIPLLFVAPAIVVDLYGPAYFSPGYVNEAFCFPIQFPGNLIFFTGPVFATIIINTACILQIIIRVHLAQVAARNIRQSSLFTEAKIFLRILSISGCFWVTGIMAAYFKSEWLEYVFTVLCGLQGLFLATANLTTRCSCSLSGDTQNNNEN